MTWSWCIAEQQNVEATPERRCPSDGSLVIAPSWGKRTQVWQDGTWSPKIAKPEGHRWKPPVTPEPQKSRKVAPRDTDTVLGRRTATDRKRASRARALPKVKVTTVMARPCEYCREPFFPKARGTFARFCSTAHQKAAARKRAVYQPRPPMSASGRVCVACGSGEHPHRGHGLCLPCWRADRRRRKREEVAA